MLTDQDRKYVYVLGSDSTAQRKDIKPGRMSQGLRVVEFGLAPGDKIIIGGLQKNLLFRRAGESIRGLHEIQVSMKSAN